MQVKWWMPVVALSVGLVAVIAIGVTVNPEIAARLKRTLRHFDPDGISTVRMDDGVHELYIAFNKEGLIDVAVDGTSVPLENVSLGAGAAWLRGVVDKEGWPLYEAVAWNSEGNLRLIPGDSRLRLGLQLAAAPDADGAWPVRADAIPPQGRVNGGKASPAQLGGVQAGDALLAVDGVRPASREVLRAALEKRRGDEPLPLLVRRGGAEIELVLQPLALNGDNYWTFDTDNKDARKVEARLAAQAAAQGSEISR